ncbi:MAG: diguanylate cyclase, partial [Deltaproteobacteria bacterium]|nr:diguanylate cyclase [Deltaproteobacteria bacterium]
MSRDPLVRGNVVNASAAAGRLYMIANDGAQLLAMIDSVRPRVVVIDRESGDGLDVLRSIAALPARDQMHVIMVVRDVVYEAFPGAHLVVFEPALGETLAMIDGGEPVHDHRPVALDRLLSLSVLSGHLDQALETAADRIADGFGVDRCIISVRGDSSGGAAVGAHTWDSLAWNHTADRCRAATMSSATLVAPAQREGAQVTRCESYLAVQLETPHGSQGFIGLVAARARMFSRGDRASLQAIASRLGAELGWRTVHERTAEELDRHVSGPGLDTLLAVWNRSAMFELGAMLLSASRRTSQPLTAIVIDVNDLQGINTRHGHEVGDRLLRRIADALRATIRNEDLVGRWAGDKVAVVLHATSIDGAQRVAQRLQAALAARPIELANGSELAIPVAIGLAPAQPNEEFPRLMQRASWAAGKAQEGEAVVASASIGPIARLSQQIDTEEVRATLGGSYRLLHEISRGGMGVVYRAEDLSLERPVAIKMLRPDLGEDHALVEQLRREAAMLARLQHPNLVQIYNFGQTGGDSYFVMELVEGEGLQQAVERHRAERSHIGMAELANVIEQVASALDALHERGIVHRDVKPANVIRDPFRNRSVLVDVGIARKYGQFVESAGTPGFIAPEVIGGREATPRADVYGLAATAYTVLTLRPPWGDEDYATILARQVGDAVPKPPSELRGDLATDVDEVILGALDRDPERRP